jgi:hypothetical protein
MYHLPLKGTVQNVRLLLCTTAQIFWKYYLFVCMGVELGPHWVLRKIFGPNSDRRLKKPTWPNEQVVALGGGVCSTLRNMINSYQILVSKSEGQRPLGTLRRTWEDNIKIDLRKWGCEDGKWIRLTEASVPVGTFHKRREISRLAEWLLAYQ